MGLDGDAVADAAGAKVMRLRDFREGTDDVLDFALGVLREGHVREFAGAGFQEVPGHFYEHGTHDDGGQGIQDGPFLAQEECSADTDGGADGRQRVAAVVPGIGNDSRRLQRLAASDCITEEHFLHHNRQERSPKGERSRHFEGFSLQPAGEFHGPGYDDADGGADEGQGDEQRGQGLEFSVSIVMGLVLGLRADAHEHQDDQVCQKIRQRVHGIGRHRGAVSHDAGDELESEEHQIPDAPYQSDD